MKKQKQARKYDNMEKGGKAFILLKLHENIGHITNFQLFPIVNKTITNYKHIRYGVWSKCCKSIYSKYIVERGTFLRTYWITATSCSFSTANCLTNATDWQVPSVFSILIYKQNLFPMLLIYLFHLFEKLFILEIL